MEAKLPTGAMIVKEFTTQCLESLQSRLKPLWAYEGTGDALRLRVAGMKGGEADVAWDTLLSCIPGDILEAHAPLYSRDDMKDLVASMPAFNKLGLEPPDHPDSPMELSSGNSDGDEDSEETEDDDPEEASPSSWRDLLLGLDDDDADADELPAVDSSWPTRTPRRAESTPSTAQAPSPTIKDGFAPAR